MLVPVRAHLGVGGHECQMARPHLICTNPALNADVQL